ncbi:MAG: insulinase family protein [Chitinispirillaceae bacterium]|nr:insulinase family protein [Chitinispirillaceae bacterium]
MKIKNIFIIISSAGIISFGFTKTNIPSHPSKLTFDSLKWEVPLGTPYRTELKNGIVAYVASDSTLPLVNITTYIRYGSIAEPKGKEGLASLLAVMLRSGGTKNFKPDTIDVLVDMLALNLSFSAGETQFTFNGSFLSEYLDTALILIKEMFTSPIFDERKLEKERQIMKEAILHRFDNPKPTLSYAYDKCMYEGEAPARMSTLESITKIKREDLFAIHKNIFRPNNIIFCIAGDFNRDSIILWLENLFTLSINKVDSTIEFPKVSVNKNPSILLVHKPISQAYVRIGLPLFQRPHPDYYPVSVLNHILGGDGFTSRLGRSVRSDAGLTYSIYSNAESNYIYPATFYIDFFTKTESFEEALKICISEIRKIIVEGVKDEELNNAKSTLISELPSMFRTVDDIVTNYGWNEYYHRPPDHFRVYPEKIKAITKEDILRVAKQYLKADSISLVVVGDTTHLLKSEIFLNKKYKVVLPEEIPSLP